MAELNSILIVGCGNMGGAMLAGWLAGGFDPARFTIFDPHLAAAPAGVRLLRALPAGPFDAILLGVKPQALGQVAPQLAVLAGAGTVLLSVLAGVELVSLRQRFPHAAAIVRVMPNLAAALGKSPVALAGFGLAGCALADPQRAALTRLMQPLGTPEWFADDQQFDLLTALVGSGPAFVYRLVEALGAGAAALGMEPAQASRLAIAMVEGAAALAAAAAATADASPAELARRVTSPGGTTAAGLAVLDQNQALSALIEATLHAAQTRGAELAAAARAGA